MVKAGYSWSSSGKEYYNQIYDRIDGDRQKNSKEFDKYFLDYMIIMEETRVEQKQSNNVKRPFIQIQKLKTFVVVMILLK